MRRFSITNHFFYFIYFKRRNIMDQIRISDITMKQTGKEFSLSFKEKLEIPKLLDKLGKKSYEEAIEFKNNISLSKE